MTNLEINKKIFKVSKKIYKNYKFFWKPSENNGYFSQWFLSNFKENEITFNCAEQYMMFHKALLFNDIETANEILTEKNPKNHKQLGRKIKNFDSTIWDLNKCLIVYNGNFLKFSQNQQLKNILLFIDDETLLVETSPFDKIWGCGMTKQEAEEELKNINVNFNTQNLLGLILTTIKNNLK